ncbi:hypothetical protein HIM_05761 [Hirsutella minnesotensis 3608]|uniref:Uncharacterized protein n=1 Tax=Hirsutella minnesotensis 3608 TaxID=1043627 RepID=A0A0F7ZZX0_9HYPO|nr:hypothetical protein HIM_05761 [Hirsutella minnesotensis 3608]
MVRAFTLLAALACAVTAQQFDGRGGSMNVFFLENPGRVSAAVIGGDSRAVTMVVDCGRGGGCNQEYQGATIIQGPETYALMRNNGRLRGEEAATRCDIRPRERAAYCTAGAGGFGNGGIGNGGIGNGGIGNGGIGNGGIGNGGIGNGRIGNGGIGNGGIGDWDDRSDFGNRGGGQFGRVMTINNFQERTYPVTITAGYDRLPRQTPGVWDGQPNWGFNDAAKPSAINKALLAATVALTGFIAAT